MGRPFSDPAGWQLQNMLIVARIMAAAALARQESRGVHARRDFPLLDESSWRGHLAFQRQPDGSVSQRFVPLPSSND